MEQKIIITSDGSHSIYVPELNEHYHSIHGAIQESNHVFIEAGLKPFLLPSSSLRSMLAGEVKILEIGFGTGLNALLTFLAAENSDLKINYTTIEAFPLKEEIVKELNYVSQLNVKEDLKIKLQNIFEAFHSCEWEKDVSISEHFTFKKILAALQSTRLAEKQFDLIYFDAFGPPVQPEMWTEEVFSKIAAATKQGGVLVTYCAKGEVKRTLKKAGFSIENLPGPPGKREMVRAVKV
jgi:tRNA U34 5-methylaminomethyl-2-thiouridine-forming methyltransferase MnmC